MNTSALLITDATLGSIAKTAVNPHQNWISKKKEESILVRIPFPNQTVLVELPMAFADEILILFTEWRSTNRIYQDGVLKRN